MLLQAKLVWPDTLTAHWAGAEGDEGGGCHEQNSQGWGEGQDKVTDVPAYQKISKGWTIRNFCVLVRLDHGGTVHNSDALILSAPHYKS